MKVNPWSFGILFMLIAVFLMINDFKWPTIFLFEETIKTKAKITETAWGYGISGRPVRVFTYEYLIEDSLYIGKFKGNFSYKNLKVNNSLLIEYAEDKPEKHKVIGYYKPLHKDLK